MKPVAPVTKTLIGQAYSDPGRGAGRGAYTGTRGSFQERADGPDPLRSADGAGVANPRARQRALAIGIVDGRETGEEPLAELKELLRTAGVATAGEATQQRPQPDPDRYFGRGRLDELKERSPPATRTWSPATTSSPRARSATWRRRWACR